MEADYIIIGSGLTGSVIARQLTDQGKRVLILERRAHVGGNVHDHLHESGIRIHTYGPHFFRTSSDRIWSFVNKFSSFYKFEAQIKTYVDHRYENWPISGEYINRTIGKHWSPDFNGAPENFEEKSLSMMPREIYEKFVKSYTEKQWGVPAKSLSADLAKRFNVRHDNDPRLVVHKYQGLPMDGYSTLMVNMLKGIDVICDLDYLKFREYIRAKKMVIFTGPIDAYFNFRFGKLKYRGQRRRQIYLKQKSSYQDHQIVNYPSKTYDYIRIMEWKKLMQKDQVQDIRGTVITRETPIDPKHDDNFEYPFPDEENQNKYLRYNELANTTPNLLICGRLGEYRYYDMDQAIGRALVLADRILKEEPVRNERREEITV